MFCQLLLYSKVTQSLSLSRSLSLSLSLTHTHTHTHSFSHIILHHVPSQHMSFRNSVFMGFRYVPRSEIPGSLFSIFWGPPMLFSIVAVPVHTSTKLPQSSLSPQPHQHLLCIVLGEKPFWQVWRDGLLCFWFAFPCWLAMLSILSHACWLSACLLWGVWCFFIFLFYLFFLSFCHFLATPAAYRGSQARGRIGAIAMGLRQSHSNAGSEPRLRPTPQLTATLDR